MNIFLRQVAKVSNAAKKAISWFEFKYRTYYDRQQLELLLKDVPEELLPYYRTILASAQEYFKLRATFHGKALDFEDKELQIDFHLKVIKRVIKELLPLRHIIGFQPISSPVAQIFTLGVEEFSSPDESNKDSLSSDFPALQRKLKLSVAANVVEACCKRLGPSIKLETLMPEKGDQFLKDHNIDLTKELIFVFATEIANELIGEIVQDLRIVATKNSVIDISSDKRSLIHAINQMGADIHRNTHRGCGNVILTTPYGVSQLQIARDVIFRPAVADGKDANTSNVKYVGDIVDSSDRVKFKVLSTICGGLDDSGDQNVYIVAYNGTQHTDTGYVYSPYVILGHTGIMIHPETYEPEYRYMSRYGKHLVGEKYFGLVKQ